MAADLSFTPGQMEAAKAAKSPEELVTKAKEQGLDISLEQAESFLNPAKEGELSDEELENVAGGWCRDKRGREVVTLMTRCMHGVKSEPYGLRKATCGNGTDDESAFNHPDIHSGSGAIKNLLNWGGAGKKNCRYLSYEKGIWYCNYNVMPHY